MKKLLVATALVAGVAATPAFAAIDAKALAGTKGCLACHAIDKKVVGPSYQEVAKKYKGDKTAVDKLAAKVKNGGAGVWGQMPMPPNNVTPEEAKALATWVLSQ